MDKDKARKVGGKRAVQDKNAPPKGRKILPSMRDQDIQSQLTKNRSKNVANNKKQLQPIKTVSFVMEGLDAPSTGAEVESKEGSILRDISPASKKAPSPPRQDKGANHRKQSYGSQGKRHVSLRESYLHQHQNTNANTSPQMKRKQRTSTQNSSVFSSQERENDYVGSSERENIKHSQKSPSEANDGLNSHNANLNESGATDMSKLDASTEKSILTQSQGLPASLTINLYLNQDGQPSSRLPTTTVVSNRSSEDHRDLNVFVKKDSIQPHISPRRKSYSPLRRSSRSPPRIYPEQHKSRSPNRTVPLRRQSRSPVRNSEKKPNERRQSQRNLSRSPGRPRIYPSIREDDQDVYQVEQSNASTRYVSKSTSIPMEREDVNILVVDQPEEAEASQTLDYYEDFVRESRKRERRRQRMLTRNLPPLGDESSLNHNIKVEQWLQKQVPGEDVDRQLDSDHEVRGDDVFDSPRASQGSLDCGKPVQSQSAVDSPRKIKMKQKPEIFKRKSQRTLDTLESLSAIRQGMKLEKLELGKSSTPLAWSPAPPTEEKTHTQQAKKKLPHHLRSQNFHQRHRSLSPLNGEQPRPHRRHMSEAELELMDKLKRRTATKGEDMDGWKRATIDSPMNVAHLWKAPPELEPPLHQQHVSDRSHPDEIPEGTASNVINADTESEDQQPQVTESLSELPSVIHTTEHHEELPQAIIGDHSSDQIHYTDDEEIFERAANVVRQTLEDEQERDQVILEDNRKQVKEGTGSAPWQVPEEVGHTGSSVLDSSVFGDSGFQSHDESQFDGPLEIEEDEVYVCYLQTEAGAVIGPMMLDINSTEIGLPNSNSNSSKLADRKTRLSQVQEEEENVDPEEEEDVQQEEDNNEENIEKENTEIKDKTETPMSEGLRNRQTGSNSVNEHSSRSHSLLTVHIDTEIQDPDDENLYITKHGKLSFVDLAGSEKVKNETSTSAGHLVESNNINKSLLVLGNCISALGDPKRRQGHIPYRDSKLTKLLADSLGGNGVTLMIACVSPSLANGAETLNTLRYANRAKKIKSKPVVKMDPREKLIMSLKREVKVLRQENHYLRQQLEFPVKPRGQLQKENDEKFLEMIKEQAKNEVVADHGLYEMLQEYMIENETLRNENSDMHHLRDQSRRDQQLLARDNERLLRKLEQLERERAMAYTPVSVWSVNSSRHGSATDFLDRSPQGTPQWAGHAGGQPPYDQYSRDPSWNGPPTQRRMQNGPLDGPMELTPRGSIVEGYPVVPPAGGNLSHHNTPPQRLQHPMKPPHRLAEPVIRSPQQGGSPRQGYSNRRQSQQQMSPNNGSYQNTRASQPQQPSQVHGGPPKQGGYGGPPQQGPPQQGGYGGPPKQGGYGGPPQQGGYGGPPKQGGYGGPPPQGGHGGHPQPAARHSLSQEMNGGATHYQSRPEHPRPQPRKSKGGGGGSSSGSLSIPSDHGSATLSSHASTTESIQEMNERLRQELLDLEGQIRDQSRTVAPNHR